MSQIHLFVMDPKEKINPKLDSSLRIAFCLHQAGHRIFSCEIGNLRWSSIEKAPAACTTSLSFGSSPEEPIWSDPVEMNLNSFHMIHMRKEPPVNLNFLAATWLFDALHSRTIVVNAPAALRSLNEKAMIMHFPDHCAPALISQNPIEIAAFIFETCANDAIIKPLDQFGGRGIERILVGSHSRQSLQNAIASIISQDCQPRLIQPFDHKIYDGEVRVFTVNGEPLTWSLKKPAPGSFFANTGSGASIHEYSPSEQENAMITNVASSLFEKGIFLCGFDVIGGKISEINITSPRILQPDSSDLTPYRSLSTALVSLNAFD